MESHIWLLDSSTFINMVVIDRIPLLVLLRSPLFFPEYVLRVELVREDTKKVADEWCFERNKIAVSTLTIRDLDRIAALGAPRKISIGEIACAIIAERDGGGVLCDDRKAIRWLKNHVNPVYWHGVEDVLLDAAKSGYIGEHDLESHERVLLDNKYKCYCNLRFTYLQFLLNGS